MKRTARVRYIRGMRRNATTRIMTVLYAVWLVVALGAQTAQPCPTHDAASFAGTRTATPGMVMAHHAAHDATHASGHGSHGGAHHACTCVGCCCVSALDLASAGTAQVPASRIVAAARRAPAAACRAPASRATRLLPFANGPPAASTVTA